MRRNYTGSLWLEACRYSIFARGAKWKRRCEFNVSRLGLPRCSILIEANERKIE